MPDNSPQIQKIIECLRKDHPEISIIVNGQHGIMPTDEYEATLKEWAENAFTYSLEKMRTKRDQALRDSDWTQIPDAPVDAKAWAAYRQQLRDLPATIEDPTQPVDWPTPPA